MYSIPIKQLIDAFKKLPSVGERTAERFVFHLLKSGKKPVGELTLALKNLIENVQSCDTCWDFSDNNPCSICADKKRDASIVCVVKSSQDVQTMERTGEFIGQYHILRGVVRSHDPSTEKFLKIPELLKRLEDAKTSEVILALSPDIDGETTMMLLEKHIKKKLPDIKITRLARGLPMGSDVQYADEITLGKALKHRTQT